MKFAPFHTLMICLLICSISCKDNPSEANEPDKKQNIVPNSERNFDNKKNQDIKEDPGTLKPTKEQLDRAIEKKKKNSILDSLKPKTA
ncbi:hypothetical protein [Eudoraea adriatica]|uniref:hypothetical protein n=1 Tax=Eudoraea adriatica TaxID=446681 RepID=UPI00036FE5E6|nr:hypothetical protein [Eudoraea adriatica]